MFHNSAKCHNLVPDLQNGEFRQIPFCLFEGGGVDGSLRFSVSNWHQCHEQLHTYPYAGSSINYFRASIRRFFLTNEFSETKNTSSASLISKQNNFAFLKWSWGQLLPHSSTFPTRFLSWLDEENVEICPFLKTREQNFVRNLDSNLIYRW